jgi:hypothetical protein
VERSSDSTLDKEEMKLSGRDRVGWGVCRVRENLVAGLGWVVVLCCEGSAKRKRRVASEQRRDGMSSKGRKEGRKGGEAYQSRV